MKLEQPEKKADELNLDLTIMIDANEEQRGANRFVHHQPRRTAAFGINQQNDQSSAYIENSDI